MLSKTLGAYLAYLGKVNEQLNKPRCLNRLYRRQTARLGFSFAENDFRKRFLPSSKVRQDLWNTVDDVLIASTVQTTQAIL